MDRLTAIMTDPVEIPYRHQCSAVPNGPDNVHRVLICMELADPTFGYDRAFYDRLGRSVCVPRTSNNAKFFDDGYTKALWNYRTGNMLIGEDNETLYVRDVDESGENKLLNSWHVIASVEYESRHRHEKRVSGMESPAESRVPQACPPGPARSEVLQPCLLSYERTGATHRIR